MLERLKIILAVLGIIVSFYYAVKCSSERFSNPELTETQLFLKCFAHTK